MVRQPGAPPPRHAEPQGSVAEGATSLSVDSTGRQPRNYVPSFPTGSKSAEWTSEAARHLSPSPAPDGRLSPGPGLPPNYGRPVRLTRSSFVQRFWARNKGPVLVATSQLFGALMNLSARLLETEGKGMHPVQVLLIRQSITSLACLTYMWWMSTPGAPFGPSGIRILLVIRGISGFFGIFG
jgi:hypothetical protein